MSGTQGVYEHNGHRVDLFCDYAKSEKSNGLAEKIREITINKAKHKIVKKMRDELDNGDAVIGKHFVAILDGSKSWIDMVIVEGDFTKYVGHNVDLKILVQEESTFWKPYDNAVLILVEVGQNGNISIQNRPVDEEPSLSGV